MLVRRTAIVAVLVVLSGVVLGIAFAGSPARLASGVRISGVDVGGMTPGAAKALLRQKWAALEHVPVSFRAGGDLWRLSPSQLGVRPDWGAAVDDARFPKAGRPRVRRGRRAAHVRLRHGARVRAQSDPQQGRHAAPGCIRRAARSPAAGRRRSRGPLARPRRRRDDNRPGADEPFPPAGGAAAAHRDAACEAGRPDGRRGRGEDGPLRAGSSDAWHDAVQHHPQACRAAARAGGERPPRSANRRSRR